MRGMKCLCTRRTLWELFSDFMEIMALCVSNSVDFVHIEERGKQLQELFRKYTDQERMALADLINLVGDAVEEKLAIGGPEDVLGELYETLDLANEWNGQFFTPPNICEMMGMMVGFEAEIKDKGYVTVLEPACGAGAMVLGLAKGIAKAKLDYRTGLVVTAVDNDIRCVYMCYTQLSLYGIPAVVIHGDSLRMEEWSRWYTPAYMLGGWVWRQRCGLYDRRYADDELIKMATQPMYAALMAIEAGAFEEADQTVPAPEEYGIVLHETDNGQMSLI